METLIVNGVKQQYAAGEMPSTLAILLDQLNIKTATVVAEINGEVVDRQEFAETKLSDGQKIELIRFMGGG